MKNLPKIISTKDAKYLEDMFNWNLVNAQKYNLYVELTEDNKINNLLNELITMHLDFCEVIIKLLESGEKND